MLLSTVNVELMQQIRHEVRIYDKAPGYRYETYSKARFIHQSGISIYVPSDHALYKPERILRTLFMNYKSLFTKDITLISTTTFEDDPPGYDPRSGKRSRIGDKIILLDSPDLADKLKTHSEDERFHLNHNFTISLKGGVRGNQAAPNFSAISRSVVMSATTSGFDPRLRVP